MRGLTNSSGIAAGVVSSEYTAAIGTAWTGEAAPYTQEVTVSGILSSDRPIVDIEPSESFETAQKQLEEWGYVYRIIAGSGKLTVYASEPTTVSLPIKIKAVRK